MPKLPAPPILFAILLFLLASCALSEETRIRHYRTAGDDAFARGNYAEAEKEYKAALELARHRGVDKSNFVFAAGDLAKLYSAEKRDVEAEDLYRQRLQPAKEIWATNPERLSQVYYDLALFYLTKHKYDAGKPI